MLLHREASRVISDAFELYASAADRAKLVREFYGKEVMLFFSTEDSSSLKELLKDADLTKRRRVFEAMKQHLFTVYAFFLLSVGPTARFLYSFNNPDKGTVTFAIVHRVLWEFLQEINQLPEEECEKCRREMFESCQELLADMVHTRDGSRLVREFIVQGNAKVCISGPTCFQLLKATSGSQINIESPKTACGKNVCY